MNLATIMAENKRKALEYKNSKGALKAKSILKSFDETDLLEIKGVGEETARILFENGISTKEELKENQEIIDGLNFSVIAKKGINKFLKQK